MKRVTSLMLIVGLTLSAAPVLAGNGNGNGKGAQKGENKVKVTRSANPGNVLHCPPGLAKKAVPCVPPGHVKARYGIGDRIERDYFWIDDPYRHGLQRNGYYVRAGDYVYQVDRDTPIGVGVLERLGGGHQDTRSTTQQRVGAVHRGQSQATSQGTHSSAEWTVENGAGDRAYPPVADTPHHTG